MEIQYLKDLAIIGCGWLGKPLALSLKQSGKYRIWCTSLRDRSEEFKKEDLPYTCLDIHAVNPLPAEVSTSDVLIYTIPPLTTSAAIAFFIQIPKDKKIIFLSSTSVYPKNAGNIDENSKLIQSSILSETESFIRSHFLTWTILRLGGLYGGARHPVFSLAGKKELTTAAEWLHLVSLQDCIKGISAVIEKNVWNETINLISDLRIKKEIYYTAMARKLSLPVPKYLQQKEIFTETKLSNEKSKKLLEIEYLNPEDYERL